MKTVFQNSKLKKFALAVRPWAIFIGVFFVLKVTGLAGQISFLTQSALLKAGVMDVQVVDNAPKDQTFNYDFAIRDLAGKKLEVSDLKGKVIFLNLWATWCGPCRAEMPSIQGLYNAVDKDKITFVMLSLDQEGQKSKIENFISDRQFTFPVYQPASSLPKLLRVNTIPTTFIIGPDGKVKSKKTGMANYDTEEMREYLTALSDSASPVKSQ